jgi:Uri superfamily endonuclease
MLDFTAVSRDLPAVTGAYLLVLDIKRTVILKLPRFQGLRVEPGRYAYVGSARGPGGIKARCKRHLRKQKKLHWHIDHLTSRASSIVVAAFPDGHECRIADEILKYTNAKMPFAGFGSSDCSVCRSHLLLLPGHLSVSEIAMLNNDITGQAG